MKSLKNQVLLFVLLLALWSCGSEEKPSTITDSKTVPVKLVEVEQKQLATEITGAGLLNSSREASAFLLKHLVSSKEFMWKKGIKYAKANYWQL